jgi:hypothetical protein
MKITPPSTLIALTFLCLAAVGSKVHALNPPPDGDYPNFTTAEGQNALLSLTSGAGNTAVGSFSLRNVTTGSFNTGVGAFALVSTRETTIRLLALQRSC